MRAQEPRELGELGSPDAKPIEIGRVPHEDRIRLAGEREPAIVAEHRDTVDKPEKRIEAMLDDEEGPLAPDREGRERGDDLARADGIEVRGRLVEDERVRAHREE